MGRSGLGVAVLLIALVAALAAGVARGWWVPVDRAALFALSGGSARLWHMVSVSGDTIVRIAVALTVAAWALWRRRVGDALFLAMAVGGGLAVNALAKAVFDRPRPDLLPHLDEVGVLSFPSGHSAGAMVLGLALARVSGRSSALVAALAYAGLVGISRVALAVHWPSDVLAGWASGAAWVLLLSVAFDRSGRGRDRRSRSR